ncbi:uncharacterized protein ACIBXB_004559 [Morphnus guianensis]
MPTAQPPRPILPWGRGNSGRRGRVSDALRQSGAAETCVDIVPPPAPREEQRAWWSGAWRGRRAGRRPRADPKASRVLWLHLLVTSAAVLLGCRCIVPAGLFRVPSIPGATMPILLTANTSSSSCSASIMLPAVQERAISLLFHSGTFFSWQPLLPSLLM